MAANVTVFSRKTQPEPIAATRTPATAGPINRAELNEVEFRATALERWVSGTISDTKVCRTGASNVATMPKPSANAYTVTRSATPNSTMSPSPAASTPMRVWVTRRILRRS